MTNKPPAHMPRWETYFLAACAWAALISIGVFIWQWVEVR